MSTIAPISITPAPPENLPNLHDFFAPGGILSQSSLAFEHRRGQYEMARSIEKAFKDKRHLIVEAGTGTGKTLAYLLPALRMARERQQRVIISTGTKNLQEQLFFKDVPFLESLLGPLKVCYMKGRSNYLCRHKLYALRDNPLLNGLEEIDQFHHIAAWEKNTETGDRAEIDALPDHPRSGTNSTPAPKPASANPAQTGSAASSPPCGAKPSSPTSSSSTIISSSPTSASSSKPPMPPTQASSPKPPQ